MVYYLGTDAPAPLSPLWSEAAPAFHVAALNEVEELSVRAKLRQRNVVYFGSRQRCGCGFRTFDEALYLDDCEKQKESDADHTALLAYLLGLNPDEASIQIFGCWSGDEDLPIEHSRHANVEDIINSDFGFREREIITFSKQKD